MRWRARWWALVGNACELARFYEWAAACYWREWRAGRR